MKKNKINPPESTEEAYKELLNDMYVNNVQKRLRELNDPTHNDCRRWVWELIQNAKDSISNDLDREDVDIEINIKEDQVEFIHNGSPFTAGARLGLLYKYSKNKNIENKSTTNPGNESTGRFGTGFLTTHTLSKVVKIEGDLYKNKDLNEICGFSATMYRDGLTESELLDGLRRMCAEEEFTEELNKFTTYTYKLATETNRNALKLGLENFKENICQTLLFCKEVSLIKLNDNGVITTIKRLDVSPLGDNLNKASFCIEVDGNEKYRRHFIYTSIDEFSDYLTKRYKTNRNIRLTAAIEVDNKNNVIENISSPSHFCVLPLVGSEKHIMPIYLNSPDFEPDSERESLILTGDDIIAGKDVISEGGINRLILNKSINLYRVIVEYLTNNNFGKLYLLAKGLRKTPKVERNFNEAWFGELIEEYRTILAGCKVVGTDAGMQSLLLNSCPNVKIPKDSKEESQKELYDLCSKLFHGKVPSETEYKEWAKYAWDDCGIYKTADLCKYIEEQDIDSLFENTDIDKWKWINDFLKFVFTVDNNLLDEYRLIPNRDGVFTKRAYDGFSQIQGISSYSLDCLKKLGEDLNPILMSEKITAIDLQAKKTIEDISSLIDNRIKAITSESCDNEQKLEKLKPILNIIPNDSNKYNTDFISKQQKIHSFITNIFPSLELVPILNNDLNSKAWRELHEWCIIALCENISSFEQVNSLPENIANKIHWIDNFIGFIVKEKRGDLLDEYRLLPNQSNIFCFRKELSKDNDIPPIFKSSLAEGYSLNLKSELLNTGITSINLSKIIGEDEIITKINNIFPDETKDKDIKFDNLGFALFLSHILPSGKSEQLHESQSTLQKISAKLYSLECLEFTPTTIEWSKEGLWNKSKEIVINNIISFISEKKNIKTTQNDLSSDTHTYDLGDTIILLNDIFKYLLSVKRLRADSEIFPNQDGNFCSKDNLYICDNIPPEILNIAHKLGINYRKRLVHEDFEEVYKSTLHNADIKNKKKGLSDIAQYITTEILSKYKLLEKSDDKNYKDVIGELLLTWAPNNEETFKKYFNDIYKKKEIIEMNVLWSIDDRQRMQRARAIDPHILDKFIEGSVNIEELRQQQKTLEEKIKQQKEGIVLAEHISQIIEVFPDITVDRIKMLLALEEQTKGWNPNDVYEADNEGVKKRNFENGYKGEAFIYKHYLDSNEYKTVKWVNKSEVHTSNAIIDNTGDYCHIEEKGLEYDILLENQNEEKIYVEVKSTRTSLSDSDRISMPISCREWTYNKKLSPNEQYIIVRVFNVENSPEPYFLHMQKNH